MHYLTALSKPGLMGVRLDLLTCVTTALIFSEPSLLDKTTIAPIASIVTLLFWQTPDFFDLAQSCKHLFVLFINCRSLRLAEKLDQGNTWVVSYVAFL